MSASKYSNELCNLILNDSMTALSVYPISFDFDLLTLTVFTLRN